MRLTGDEHSRARTEPQEESPGQKRFWDQAMERFEPTRLDPITFRQTAGKTLATFLELIGDPRGLDVLEIGCGKGHLSVYIAKLGAHVTAVDTSTTAVVNTTKLAALNEVELQALEIDANRLPALGKRYDLVVGQFILHHIEPFDVFVDTLHELLKPTGRAIFMENSARNPVLMFSRRHIIGRFGIPKFGDEDEHPLQPSEVSLLRAKFPRLVCHYPELLFFRLVNAYLFRNNRFTLKVLDALDAWLFRFRFMRKYTYYQLIEAHRS